MAGEIDWSNPDYSDYGGGDNTSYNSDGSINAGGTAYSSDLNPSELSGTDLSSLFSNSKAFSGIAKVLGATAAGKLADKLFGVTGGPGGYKGGIPTLTASRQQYAMPGTGALNTNSPSNQEIRDYLSRPGLTDAMVAGNMNKFGVSPDRIAGITGLPTATVNQRFQAATGPNLTARRPGSGGVTYFSPMQYTKAGAAPAKEEVAIDPARPNPIIVPEYAAGGIADLGGYSDGGRLLKGPGDGVSDSIPATIGKDQPARLADGEFVIPARIVSELGNGSTEAGARKLYAMMDRIKKARRKAKNIAADTKSDKYLPA